MEYMSGKCLEAELADHPQGLPLQEALAWFHGIAAGVAYLHDHGIVHRDLKPGNIFCDEGVVKVGDYGLSKFISCSRRSGHTESIGTVHYMAPEVAHGRYGKELDIYALGAILYELLTGPRAVRRRKRGRSAHEAPHRPARRIEARRALSQRGGPGLGEGPCPAVRHGGRNGWLRCPQRPPHRCVPSAARMAVAWARAAVLLHRLHRAEPAHVSHAGIAAASASLRGIADARRNPR